MHLHRLQRSQILPISPKESWVFFSDPGNLARITPPWLDFQVTSTPYLPMYAGQILAYRVAPLPGIRVPWTTEITHVTAPDFFVDEQRMGPYRFWHHQHFFIPHDQGTQMDDLVHYALPFWPFGEFVHFEVRRRLNAIFDFRRAALVTVFGSL